MGFSISVVIPNYNGRSLLEQNIPLVINALETSNIHDYEIIIPDDNSVDDSVSFLKNSYPQIEVIESTKNCGFSGNTNKGIYASRKDLIFILNSDVQLTPFYFTTLLPYFNSPDTFGVCGRITSMDGDKIQDGAKYPEYSFSNIISTKNYISKTQYSLPTLFMSGANALIDREKLLKMGGFNELFNPYYSEDVDLGLRAWRLGYKIYYDHRAICKHPNSETIKKEPSKKVKIVSKRNKLYVHFLHLYGVELFFFILKTTLKYLFRLLVFDLKFAQSYHLFIQNIVPLIRIKKEFEKSESELHIQTISEIVKFIKSEIRDKDIVKF